MTAGVRREGSHSSTRRVSCLSGHLLPVSPTSLDHCAGFFFRYPLLRHSFFELGIITWSCIVTRTQILYKKQNISKHLTQHDWSYVEHYFERVNIEFIPAKNLHRWRFGSHVSSQGGFESHLFAQGVTLLASLRVARSVARHSVQLSVLCFCMYAAKCPFSSGHFLIAFRNWSFFGALIRFMASTHGYSI